MKEKRGLSFLMQVVIEILFVIAVFAFLAFFISSAKYLDTKRVALEELAYSATILDEAEISFNTSEFNASELRLEDSTFSLSLAPLISYKAKIYASKEMTLEGNHLKIGKTKAETKAKAKDQTKAVREEA
ncbi:MAG: hypothetical protein QXE64_01590 [Candidatus Pacearchaeota archaeon]